MEKVVIATTTMYESPEEIRFKLALQTIRKARNCGYQIVVVDESPDPRIQEQLLEKNENVLVGPKISMGGTRRTAFRKATELAGPDGIIVWMEPEKHTFVHFIKQIVDSLLKQRADLVIPRRKSMKTYPEIQRYNEPFGNAAFRIITGRALDVWFGPQIFRAGLVNYYLGYDGEYGDKWDSIQVPVVRMIADNRKIIEIVIAYTHPKAQRTEDTLEMLKRRFEQINNLTEAVEQEAIKLKIFNPP